MKTLLLDFDGVIGSQEKYIGPGGERAFLKVSSRDSWAIRELLASGVDVVIVTASKSKLISDYAKRHGCKLIVSDTKAGAVHDTGIDWGETVAIGDDVSDYKMMCRARTAFCPADAHPRLKRHFPALESRGGEGVVSEFVHKSIPYYAANGMATKY